MVNQKEIEYYKLRNIDYEIRIKPFSQNGVDEKSQKLFGDFLNILNILKTHDGKDIFECACGGAWLSKMLYNYSYNITAFDQSEELIQGARKYCEEHRINIDLRVSDFEDFQLEKKYDIAVIYDALHHTKDPQKVLSNIYLYLKDGGMAVIAEPSMLHRYSKRAQTMSKNTGIIEEGFSKKQLRKLLKNTGFKKVSIYLRNETVCFKGHNWLKQVVRNLFKIFFYFPKEKIWFIAYK